MPVIIPNYKLNWDGRDTMRHPLAILQEAARNLSTITDNRVRGSVLVLNPGGSDLFRYTFSIVAPTLNDFRDPLFYAWHGVNPYPVRFMASGGKQGRDDKPYDNDHLFEQALTNFFDSQLARQHITTLMDAVEQTMPNAA